MVREADVSLAGFKCSIDTVERNPVLGNQCECLLLQNAVEQPAGDARK